MATTLAARLKLEGAARYHAGMGRVTASNRAAESSVAKMTASVAKMGVALAASAAAGVADLGYALKRAADAAAEGDLAMSKLGAALRNAGETDAAALATAIGDTASQLQRLTGVSDESIVRAAALGSTMGIAGNRIGDAAKAAANFAAGSGQDIETTMKAIAMAQAGNSRGLKQWNVVVDEAALRARGLDAVLDAVNGRFDGQGAAALDNYAGRLGLVSTAGGEVVESVGRVITQNATVNAALQVTANRLFDLSGFIDENRDALGLLVTRGFHFAAKAASGLITVLSWAGKAFAAFKVVGNLAIAGIIEPLRLLQVALVKTLEGFAVVARFAGLESVATALEGVVQEQRQVLADIEGMQEVFFSTAAEGLDMWGAITDGAARAQDLVRDVVVEINKLAASMGKAGATAAGVLAGGTGGAGSGFLDNIPTGGNAAAFMDLMNRKNAGLAQAGADRKTRITSGFNTGASLTTGLSSSVLTAAGDGFMAGGPMGALLEVGRVLLMASKQFQALMEMVNGLLQHLADAIGSVLAPINTIVKPLASSLGQLLSALTPILTLLQQLNPQLAAAAFAARILGDVIFGVTRVLGTAVLGVLRAINKALHKMGISWKPLDNAISDLKKSMRDLDKNAKAAADSLGAILPEGYKLLQLRAFQESPGVPTYMAPPNSTTGGGISPSGQPQGQGNAASSGGQSFDGATFILQGVSDVASLWRELKRHSGRESTVRSGRAVYTSGGA